MSVEASAQHVRTATPSGELQTSLTAAGETAPPAEPEAAPRPLEYWPVYDIENLWEITRDALKIDPPLWISSIFGLPWKRLPPFQRYSEFRIVDLWQPLRTLKYLLNVSVPAIPRNPPEFLPPLTGEFFYQPTVILQRPDQYGSYTSFPREKWFFINGIMTNDDVAQLNAAYLSALFHRPITLIQNSTCGLIPDLAECALGKQWTHTTEAVRKAFPAIHAALKSEKEKVVVIAHSQGTIIASVVLHLLEAITQPAPARPEAVAFGAPLGYAEPIFIFPEEYELDPKDFAALTEDELAKLEIYCFANCANALKYLRPDRAVPWIENFGNEFDIVARLGMLAPRAQEWKIEIDGPRYKHPRAWGHFLNEHYLREIERHQKVRYRPGGKGGSAPYELLNAGQFPVAVPGRKGETLVALDEHPRDDVEAAALARLAPVFRAGGTVTAGNASGITDGAAAVVVASEAGAERLGLAPAAYLLDWEVVGVEPRVMGIGPVPATRRLLERARLGFDALEAIELNEAFASQVLACMRQLPFDSARVNPDGGAIALGHPIGATGARIVATLIHGMAARGQRLGLATLCVSGGMGFAALIERPA